VSRGRAFIRLTGSPIGEPVIINVDELVAVRLASSGPEDHRNRGTIVILRGKDQVLFVSDTPDEIWDILGVVCGDEDADQA
jgi:hypothetical protein